MNKNIVALLGATAMVPAVHAVKKMNIVSIVVDDLGWNDVAFMGSKYHETPNIDKLASQGMSFSNGYASCAVSSPTRASLMTGQYPARIGITDWIHHRPIKNNKNPENTYKQGALELPANYEFLDWNHETIAEVLKKAGYTTGHVGKWHLGPLAGEKKHPDFKGSSPLEHGFDINKGGYGAGQPPRYFEDYRIPTMPKDADGNNGDYLTDREAEECEAFLEANKDKPFFLNMWHYAVHMPLQAKKEHIDYFKKKGPVGGDKRKNATYAAMVKSVDDAVGRVMKKLKELGLEKNTVILFTSDNGGHCLFNISDLTPLRKGKGFPYEGGIRIPYIIKWPGVTKPGSKSDTPIISNDIYPTFCAVADVSVPEKQKVDGKNLLPILKGEKVNWSRRPLFWHFPHFWAGKMVKPYSIVRDGDWKLIHFWLDSRNELYNLKNDLSETTNLAAKMPEKVKQLRRKMDKWFSSVGAKLPKKVK